jgi:hypothetical protein
VRFLKKENTKIADMGVCQCTSKTLLGLLGLIFSLCALFLWGSSGYVIATYHRYSDFVSSYFTLVPSVVAIAVGIVFFFAGILGCCSMCKENKCILTMFGVFMFLLLGLLVAASVVTFKFKDEIHDSVRDQTNKTINSYNNTKKGEENEVDYIQKSLECCGIEQYTDWFKTKWEKEFKKKTPKKNWVPYSCCNKHAKDVNCTGDALDVTHSNHTIYTEGCQEKVFRIFNANAKYIAGAVIGFCVLLVLGIICTCALCCLKRREETPYFSLN